MKCPYRRFENGEFKNCIGKECPAVIAESHTEKVFEYDKTEYSGNSYHPYNMIEREKIITTIIGCKYTNSGIAPTTQQDIIKVSQNVGVTTVHRGLF